MMLRGLNSVLRDECGAMAIETVIVAPGVHPLPLATRQTRWSRSRVTLIASGSPSAASASAREYPTARLKPGAGRVMRNRVGPISTTAGRSSAAGVGEGEAAASGPSASVTRWT